MIIYEVRRGNISYNNMLGNKDRNHEKSVLHMAIQRRRDLLVKSLLTEAQKANEQWIQPHWIASPFGPNEFISFDEYKKGTTKGTYIVEKKIVHDMIHLCDECGR